MGTIIFIFCFIACTVAWDLFMKVRSVFLPHPADRFWSGFLKRMAGFSVQLARFYAGLEVVRESDVPPAALPGRFILITNHQSLADIAILVCAFPGHDLKYAAKKELKWGIPAVSVTLRRGGHGFVNRQGGFTETMRSLGRLLRLAGDRSCPVVFPEGTRSRSGRLGRFHSAGVRFLLEHSALPVVAAAVDGGYRVQKFMDFFTKIRGLQYRTKILKVYPHVSGKAETLELLKKIERDIGRQLEDWRT